MPEHFELMTERQFGVGGYGDLQGLFLTIFIPASDELRDMRTQINTDGGPEAAADFIAQVEADPAFALPMSRHAPERFSFGIDAIG